MFSGDIEKEVSGMKWVKKDSKRPPSNFLSSTARNNLGHSLSALEVSYVEEVKGFCRYQGINGLDALPFYFEKTIQKSSHPKLLSKIVGHFNLFNKGSFPSF